MNRNPQKKKKIEQQRPRINLEGLDILGDTDMVVIAQELFLNHVG